MKKANCWIIASAFVKLDVAECERGDLGIVAVHSLKAIRTKKSGNWRSWERIGLIGCRHGGNRST
jgi:hypothetical protein